MNVREMRAIVSEKASELLNDELEDKISTCAAEIFDEEIVENVMNAVETCGENEELIRLVKDAIENISESDKISYVNDMFTDYIQQFINEFDSKMG